MVADTIYSTGSHNSATLNSFCNVTSADFHLSLGVNNERKNKADYKLYQ